MIITRYEGRLLVVRQPDHGDQTGLFAAAWGSEDVPPLTEHRRAATLAARHHDDGWAVWERRPSIDPATRQPAQFHKVGPIEHIPAYRAGVDRAAHGDPWAGLLVSMRAAGLYNGRYGTFRLPELAEQSLTAVSSECRPPARTPFADLGRGRRPRGRRSTGSTRGRVSAPPAGLRVASQRPRPHPWPRRPR